MDARYRLAPMRDLRARTERASREELAGVVHDAQALAAAVDAAARRRDALRAAITAATARRAHGLAGELAASQRRDWRGHPQLDDTAQPAGARADVPGAPIAGSLASVVGAERYLARLRHELELAEDAHARAAARHRGQLDAIDAARERLVRARAAREVIERHFAAWRTERQRLADRRED